MKSFPEDAIRERLRQKYCLRGRPNGRPNPSLEAAVRDVAACLKEIEALRRYGQTVANGEPVPWHVKEGVP
jgi:hypothetical protein